MAIESKFMGNVQATPAMMDEEEPQCFAPLATPEVSKPGFPSMNRTPAARPNSKGLTNTEQDKLIRERQVDLETGMNGTVAFKSQNDVKLGYKPFELDPSPIMSLHNRQGVNTETGQVSFSTDSTAIALSNKNIVCLSILNNYQRFLIGHEHRVSCFTVVPEDNLLVSVDENETPEVIVWRIVPSRILCRFKLEMKKVHVMSCSKFLKEGKYHAIYPVPIFM